MQNHLSELAESEINDLKSQGIEPTLNEIIWINDLSRKVENPDGARPCVAIGEPSPAGNAWLWPFTIASSRWFAKVLPWFDGNPESETLVLAFSLAHGRDVGVFSYLSNYEAVKETVAEWSDELGCTADELAEAITKILPYSDTVELDDEEESVQGASDWDEIIATLCLNVGETPEFWAYGVSCDYALRQIDIMNKQMMAGGKELDPNDPYIVATKNLGRAIISIKQEAKDA